MRISKFNIIALVDGQGGLSKDGFPPFHFNSWTKYKKDQTIGPINRRNNAVIMGRNTFENILQSKTLSQRENFVISTKYLQSDYANIVVYNSLIDCLSGIANRNKKYDDVWILGGEKLFKECIKRFLPYCNKIVLGITKDDGFDCDQFLPLSELHKRGIEKRIEQKTRDYDIVIYYPKINHQEKQFIDLLFNILDNGNKLFENDVSDKHEFLCLSNKSLEFDLSEEFPFITTRFFDYNKELIPGFIDDLENMDFSKDSIGFRLRCNKNYSGMKNYNSENNVDQLENLLEKLTKNGNVNIFLERQCEEHNYIPLNIKFRISSSKKYLDTTVCCNKMEMFKYFPYYLGYIALLSNIYAHLLHLIPKSLYFFIQDSVIDSDYYSYVRKQIQNDPKPFCTLAFRNTASIKSINEFKRDNFDFRNYESWQKMNFDRKH